MLHAICYPIVPEAHSLERVARERVRICCLCFEIDSGHLFLPQSSLDWIFAAKPVHATMLKHLQNECHIFSFHCNRYASHSSNSEKHATPLVEALTEYSEILCVLEMAILYSDDDKCVFDLQSSESFDGWLSLRGYYPYTIQRWQDDIFDG
jgi:hypothetical protein